MSTGDIPGQNQPERGRVEQAEHKIEQDQPDQHRYTHPRDAAAWDKIEQRQRGDTPLSAQERVERTLVAHPVNGVGYPYNSRIPADGEVARLMANFTEEKRNALSDPSTVVTIYGFASRPGSEVYNRWR